MFEVINVDEEGRFGGPERRIINVALALNRKSVKTTVVLPELDNELFVAYANTLGVKYQELDITRLSLEPAILLRYALRFPRELYILINFFRSKSARLVHVNGASQFKVAIAAKLSGKKIVWHLNNTYLKFPVKFIFIILSRMCADGIIYAGFRAGVYYRVTERFKNLPISNIEAPVLKNFFEIETLKSVNKKLKISVIGGVNPAKSLEDVIFVAALLNRSDFDFQISIAGKILPSQLNYYRKLDELIKSNQLDTHIKFLGEVANVPELVRKSDIILTMSNREASPTAVWEGLAAGRIVISTDVGSVRQHIKHECNGFIVGIGEIDAVATIIKNISSNIYPLSDIAMEARETAKKNFSLSTIAKRHFEIYEEILNR